jgi:mitogen-activated protein kinase kinase 4
VYDFTAEDLEDMGEIGRGNFGSVNKMLHIKTNTVMAVKVQIEIGCVDLVLNSQLYVFPLQRIRSTVDEKEQKQLLMDLEVVMRSNNCPFIVLFYGALFTEV